MEEVGGRGGGGGGRGEEGGVVCYSKGFLVPTDGACVANFDSPGLFPLFLLPASDTCRWGCTVHSNSKQGPVSMQERAARVDESRPGTKRSRVNSRHWFTTSYEGAGKRLGLGGPWRCTVAASKNL